MKNLIFSRFPSSGAPFSIPYAIPTKFLLFSKVENLTCFKSSTLTKLDRLSNVLKSIKGLYENKNIKVLFGAGGNRDKSKRVEMAKAIELFAVQCYVAPDNPRYENIDDINDDIIKGFSKHIYQVFSNREYGLKAALAAVSYTHLTLPTTPYV